MNTYPIEKTLMQSVVRYGRAISKRVVQIWRREGESIENPPRTLDGAYERGYNDYAHLPERPNPYIPGSPLSNAWESGNAQRWDDMAW
jgi:hypothetical protein